MRKILWSAGDHREHAGYWHFNFVTRDAPMSHALSGCCGCERLSCSATSRADSPGGQ